MNLPSSLSRAFALCLLAAAAPLTAVHSASPTAAPKTLGVTNSLTTSGYQFAVGLIPPSGSTVATAPTSFEASYLFANHTAGGITFTAPRPNVGPGMMAVDVPDLVFNVYDSDSKLVWSSWTDPGNLINKQGTLAAGSAWKLTAKIPLKVNDVWLHGTYTLVASVNGSPDFSATTTFHVLQVN